LALQLNFDVGYYSFDVEYADSTKSAKTIIYTPNTFPRCVFCLTFIYEGTCVETCPIGYFGNLEKREC
jgi:Fe-S-cluster-containing dehydrogenase component